jgi:predicted site-specific integrase-resolvase
MKNKITSPQEELVEDLMTIVHVFNSRLYGLRKNKNKIRNLL